ncbi:MAG: hypothetical protein FWD35_02825, partial [Oscillospiraceae bacterium]|nr:hypothetical protein [Oscillospiraceae bacterium]
YAQYGSPYSYNDEIGLYEAPGRKMIKVVSIIMIIFGALGTLGSGCLIPMLDVLEAMFIDMGAGSLYEEMEMSRTEVFYTLISGVVQCAYWLFMGIMGVKYCSDVTKAKFLGQLMYGYIVLYGIILVRGIISGMVDPIGLICGLPLAAILPVLFLVGVSKNKSRGGF